MARGIVVVVVVAVAGTLFAALLRDVAAIDASVHPAGLCPSFCACDTWYKLQRVSCVGRHIYSVYTGASGMQALELSNNSVSALKDYELADAGLSKVKYLNLSTNAISEIGLRAFDGLSELTVLDLSHNHLFYLLPNIFLLTPGLRILRLSRNNFNSRIPRLNCPWLTELSLDSCQISYVPVDIFYGLSHIRKLDLSNNMIIRLSSVTFRALKSLIKLSIEGNPWPCNKLTYDLLVYLTRNDIEYQAVCIKTSPSPPPSPSGPKMFERMIVYDPQVKHERHRPTVTADADTKKGGVMSKKSLASTPTPNNVSACVNELGFAKVALDTVLPYYFFVAGLLFGSACSMFACYLWLACKVSCCRTVRRTNDIQRFSLLRDLWQHEDPIFEDFGHRTISCPGTPPPSYREVMLRRCVYPLSSSVTRNLRS